MSYSESAPVSGSLLLEGVWLHDPADPEGTALQLRYGKNGRSSGMSVMADMSYYAGREFPVADYGQNGTDSAAVQVDVPTAPDGSAKLAALRALVALRRPLAFRDNRGRAIVPAAVVALQERDYDTGTQVSFSVDRLDG